MRSSPQITQLEALARYLGSLADEVVVVGGAVVELLLTDPGSAPVRPTNDIDIVIEIKSRLEYYKLEDRLRDLGFSQDPQEPVVCRWFGHGLILDAMPMDAAILGFSNRWYASAFRTSHTRKLPSGAGLRVIDAPHFVATKLEAFLSRGLGDMGSSHDFEDIVAVVNGRPELADEVLQSPEVLRGFLSDTFEGILKRRNLLEFIEGSLASQQDSLDRAILVRDRMQALISVP